MMKEMTYSLALSTGMLIMFGLTTCNRPDVPDCLQAAGDITSIERTFDSQIEQLELHNFIHVTLIPSDENKVIVRGPENLLPEVITTLSDGTLFIDDENSCDFVRALNIQPRVTILAHISQITNYSQGDVETFGAIKTSRFDMDSWQASGQINLEFDCDSVYYRTHTGVSKTTLSGTSNYSYIYHLGIGPVDTRSLTSKKASVRSNSINDVHVFAEDKLVAWIEGSGNIFFTGDPEDVVVIQDGDGEVLEE